MNAYIYQADICCEDCAKTLIDELTQAGKAPANPDDETSFDSDDFPKGPFPDGGGEADNPQHCANCSIFLENPLTSEGYRYVAELIAGYSARGNEEVRNEWRRFYSPEIEDFITARTGIPDHDDY